jgi:hypothetical protein
MEGNTMHLILAPAKSKPESQKPPKPAQSTPQGQASSH